MPKSRKLSQLRERRERTLNVRLPHVIKDQKDVEYLFEGNFHVKLPRQSSRSCHVVFPTVEEKIANYKLAKAKTIDGKRIVIQPLSAVALATGTKKMRKKKIFIPEIKPDVQVTQTVFVSNIVNGTKSHEVRSVLPGCVRVTLLKPYNKNFRSAIAKMENIQRAAKYLKEKLKWPILKGHRIRMKPDTRIKHKKTSPRNILKICNETMTKECKSTKRLNYTEDKDDDN